MKCHKGAFVVSIAAHRLLEQRRVAATNRKDVMLEPRRVGQLLKVDEHGEHFELVSIV